jgi:putative FmdB family regulatory protein
MPLYEYQCEQCTTRFELIQRFSDPPAHVCPSCGGGPVHKLASSPAIQFKGSGWYITDYARKGGTSNGAGKAGTADSTPAAGASGANGAAAGSAGAGEAAAPAASESKPAAKKD